MDWRTKKAISSRSKLNQKSLTSSKKKRRNKQKPRQRVNFQSTWDNLITNARTGRFAKGPDGSKGFQFARDPEACETFVDAYEASQQTRSAPVTPRLTFTVAPSGYRYSVSAPVSPFESEVDMSDSSSYIESDSEKECSESDMDSAIVRDISVPEPEFANDDTQEVTNDDTEEVTNDLTADNVEQASWAQRKETTALASKFFALLAIICALLIVVNICNDFLSDSAVDSTASFNNIHSILTSDLTNEVAGDIKL
jgi:hypothetical protein